MNARVDTASPGANESTAVPRAGGRRRPFGSLRTRLVIAASIVVTIVIGLESYLEIRIFETRAEADLREAGALTAQVVADDLELRGGLPAVGEIERSLHEFINTMPSVRAISVVGLDAHGAPHVYASTSSDERGEAVSLAADVIRGSPPEWHDWTGPLSSFALPVMRGDTREGAVVVTLSRLAVQEMRTRGRNVTLWLAPLAIVVLTLLFDQLARELIYRPLAGIELTMRRTGSGEVGARAPVLRQDELGEVAQGLNQMLDRTEGFSAVLQKRIGEATSELRASNAERIESYHRILELREALARSQQLAAVGQTAAIVAHQIGTPLNLVSGYVQLLLAEPGLDPRLARRLQIVQEQIDKVADVVRTLLDRARPSGERRPIDVRPLLERLATIVAPRLQAAHVQLDLEIADMLPPVNGEETDIELALLNLLANAVDAMPRGGRLRVAAEPSGAGLRLLVRDTGEGIPADLLPQIFEPWVTTKPAGRGSGLGLSITRDVIHRLGGTIEVVSTPGQGTEFAIVLPASPTEGPDAADPGTR